MHLKNLKLFNMDTKKKISEIYEKGFKKIGKLYQRQYPNEEFCRFMGRNFFHIKKDKRKKINFLEVGVGSGANLSLISNEGFSASGIDISEESIKISKKLFKKKKFSATLKVGDMTNIPFKSNTFDCVFDVFSSCSLTKNDGGIFLREVNRVLKKGGKFFSYFPSKKSKMFKSRNKKMYDEDTISKLNEKKSIYKIMPMRFLDKKQYVKILEKNNIHSYYVEELTRTYFKGKDQFTFVIIESFKKSSL